MTEEHKRKLIEAREAKRDLPQFKITLKDGSKKTAWGYRTNGVNEYPSEVAYKQANMVYWVTIDKIDLEARMYYERVKPLEKNN